MRRMVIAGGLVAAAALLGSCTTMSKDECLAGAWGEKGYAYESAREDGLRGYCTFERGWSEGRSGNSYYGVCRPEEKAAFLPAYRDGLQLHAVEAAVESAESALNSAEARIGDRQEKLDAKQRELRGEGLTDEEKERIRDRIQEVRGEIRDARRNAREAREALDRAEWDLHRVRRELIGRYPV